MISILDNLKNEKLDFDLVCALSAQEEVGLRGAYVTARKVKPDVCLVLESCPADDTFEPEWLSQTGLKEDRCCEIWILVFCQILGSNNMLAN